jgi:hypothetical protein
MSITWEKIRFCENSVPFPSLPKLTNHKARYMTCSFFFFFSFFFYYSYVHTRLGSFMTCSLEMFVVGLGVVVHTYVGGVGKRIVV